MRVFAPGCLFVLLACAATTPAGNDSTEEGPGTGMRATTTTTGAGGGFTTSTWDGPAGSTGGIFSTSGPGAPLDLPAPGGPCDPYAEMSCPAGQKCVWLAGNDLQKAEVVCVPEARRPILPGEPCPPDPEASGLDDCAAGSMCLAVEWPYDVWTCTPLCQGDADHPYCPPQRVCIITRTLAFCRSLCSPLVQDCPDDAVCLVEGAATTCLPEWQGTFEGAPGAICGSDLDCAPSSVCAPAEDVPDCAGEACCTPLCSVGEDAVGCPSPLQECRPIVFMGEPSLWPGLGVCRAPMEDP